MLAAHSSYFFLYFLTHLKSVCIFVAISGDFSSFFAGLGRVLGWIWGGFLEGLGGLLGDLRRFWGVLGVSWRRLREVFSTR